MGNSKSSAQSKQQQSPSSGGGGIFNCCTATNDYDLEPTSTMQPSRRVLMYSARSMYQQDSDDEEHQGPSPLDPFKEQVPLSNMSDQRGVSGHKARSFNLKEQLRLDTGLDRPALGMCFAQRKFMGFRCKYEYDAKAVLLYSSKQICLISYTLEQLGESALRNLVSKDARAGRSQSFNDQMESVDGGNSSADKGSEGSQKKFDEAAKPIDVILRWQAPANETIKQCSFVDDERPLFIFVLVENDKTHVQYLKLVKILGHEKPIISERETTSAAQTNFQQGAPTYRKSPFDLEELDKVNQQLEKIVRRKFMNGEIRDRRPGHENYFCQLADNGSDLRKSQSSISPSLSKSNSAVLMPQEAAHAVVSSEFGSMLSQDIEAGKHNDVAQRLTTEIVAESASSDDEQFQLMRPAPSGSRRAQQQPSQAKRSPNKHKPLKESKQTMVRDTVKKIHRRCRSEVPRLALPTQKKQDYFLSEVSCERIEHPREYVSYVWFNQAKLVFLFQRRTLTPHKCYPLEMYYVNNWLFFRPNVQIQSNALKTPNSSTTTSNGQSINIFKQSQHQKSHNPQHILEKQRRILHQVRGQVKYSDTLDSQIYTLYHAPATYLDVYSLSGRYIASFDLQRIIRDKISLHIKLTQLDFVLTPVLKWTGRRNKLPQSFGKLKQQFDTPRVILIGQVEVSEHQAPCKCLIVFNMTTKEVEKLKVLSFIDPYQKITCVAYGPFDNGHILLGLNDGWLLAYKYPSLERVESKQIFWPEDCEDRLSQQSPSYCDQQSPRRQYQSLQKKNTLTIVPDSDEDQDSSHYNNGQTPRSQKFAIPQNFTPDQEEDENSIASIQIDPTNLILVCNKAGKLVALTPFDQRHNYFYLELGENTFCTVGLPQARAREIGREQATLDQTIGCCI